MNSKSGKKINGLFVASILGKLKISCYGRTFEITPAPKHEDGTVPVNIIHFGDERSGEGGDFDSRKFFDVIDKFYQEHF